MSERSFDDISPDALLPSKRFGVDADTPKDQLLGLPPVSRRSSDYDSFWNEIGPEKDATRGATFGLMGIGGALFILAVVLPLEMEFVETLFDTLLKSPKFWMVILVFQVLTLPVVTVSAFVIAVPMFWYISVVKRFLITLALFVPAAILFFIVLNTFGNGPSMKDFPNITMVLASAFSASAVVGVVLQMTTPWSLTHNPNSGKPLPRLGTRTLFELTAVIAIVLAVVRLLGVGEDLLIVCLVFAAIGGSAALTGILACIGFLRDDERGSRSRRLAWIIAVITALLTSGVLVAAMSISEYGWNGFFNYLAITLPLTVTGAAIVSVVMHTCLWWLRKCGWRVVR